MLDVRGDGSELLTNGQVDQIIIILPCHGLVGGNDHHIQTVNLPELECFRIGGTSHARELIVETEVVLESRGG